MGINNFRKIAVATTLLASLGGGAVAANAAGVGPMASKARVHDATWYGDQAVRAWGAGNYTQASKYLTGGTQRALFGWKSVGGGDWQRTGSWSKGNTAYVAYRNNAGSTVTFQVNKANRNKTTRVINYVNWTIGRGQAAKPAAKANPAPSGAWVATTQGFGPIKIGANIDTLARQGLVRDVIRCDLTTSGSARGAHVSANDRGVQLIFLAKGQSTRAGIRIGSSEATLKRTYGKQLSFRGQGIGDGETLYLLPWSDGNSITFSVLNGQVSSIIVAKGHEPTLLEGGGC